MKPFSKKVLIVGSGGALGKKIVDRSIQEFGVSNVILADYNEKRLSAQARIIEDRYRYKPSTRIIDINSNSSIENGSYGVDLIIIAIQQKEPNIQKFCLHHGIHSVDVAVCPQFISKALNINDSDKKKSLNIITGGLFPGFSGILANFVSMKDKSDEHTQVVLLQSSKGSNGRSGIIDMLEILSQKIVYKNQKERTVYYGFAYKKEFDFPEPFGVKKMRLANFIEKDYLLSLGILSNYWTAFDNEHLNKLLGFLRRAGILQLIKIKGIGKAVASNFSRQNIEEDEKIGLIVQKGTAEAKMILNSDYSATAACAVAFSKLMLEKQLASHGIRFPFEIFTFTEVFAEIKDEIVSSLVK